MGRRSIGSAAIVVTQLREFGEAGEKVSLDELGRQLAALKLKNYKGLVYYHPKLANWKEDLGKLFRDLKRLKK